MTIPAQPAESFPGAPLVPTGNPMLDGVGPAAYANRADVPDLNLHGGLRIVPIGAAPGFYLEPRDPDPRGRPVYGADDEVAGTVADVWVDTAEPCLRYLEVAVSGAPNTVLLPVPYAKVDDEGNVCVQAILARQFRDVPTIRTAGRVTRLEEDRIGAYYAGGYLYAEPSRLGPVL